LRICKDSNFFVLSYGDNHVSDALTRILIHE